MKKLIPERKDMPFKKIIEPFDDIKRITEGTHDIKFSYHTLPLSCCEIDTFDGYGEILRSSPVSLQRRHDFMKTHIRSIKAAIDFIEQDCRYARALIEGAERQIHADYIGAKYDKKLKRIREKRELDYNISSDIKKFTSL